MARIPEGELERLKAEVSVERLAESQGIVLERRGQDRVGRNCSTNLMFRVVES